MLAGVGESCDAYHMSTPHPEGLGARLAMERALASGSIAPGAVGYVNLHGTATRTNDVAEGRAVHDVFGSRTPCSATKGAHGHLLGAAGITEAIVALARARAGLPAGDRQHARARRRDRLPCADRGRGGRAALRAVQLVRLRRQQLQRDIRTRVTMKAYIDGIGLLAPGLPGWRAARAVLAGDARYEPGEIARPTAEILPPAERRRCGDLVKLALHVGTEALAPSRARAEELATVFTCATGSGEVLHQICETLAGTARDVSPTRFHNSVHNAAAGYWSIATGARTPSTSLCAHQGSFAAGLLEAVVQAAAEQSPVLLVAYDLPPPPPLAAVVPCTVPCGLALLLAPGGARPASARSRSASRARGGNDVRRSRARAAADRERRGAWPADACRVRGRAGRAGDARMVAGAAPRSGGRALRRGMSAGGAA